MLGVYEAWTRWLGHKVLAELHITVDPNFTVAESHAIVESVQAVRADDIPTRGSAMDHVCPRSEHGDQPAKAMA